MNQSGRSEFGEGEGFHFGAPAADDLPTFNDAVAAEHHNLTSISDIRRRQAKRGKKLWPTGNRGEGGGGRRGEKGGGGMEEGVWWRSFRKGGSFREGGSLRQERVRGGWGEVGRRGEVGAQEAEGKEGKRIGEGRGDRNMRVLDPCCF